MRRPPFLLAISAACALGTLVAYFFVIVVPAYVQRSPSQEVFSVPSTPAVAPALLGPANSGAPTGVARELSASVVPVTSIADLQEAARVARAALVNIICITPKGSPYHSMSATGVFVTGTGYVLTNAHVAAYFLLTDRDVSCVIRTGDPATTAYRARLAYMPSEWVRHNQGLLVDPAPSGTGEYDFALLAVTESATDTPLPDHFPSLVLAYEPGAAGISVVVGSYGAQTLSYEQIASALSPTVVSGSIKKLYTFGTSTVDAVVVGGSVASQEGSSGGGVVNFSKELIGSITTSTITGTIASRTLTAISASYIRREYEREEGEPLDALLALPPATAVSRFAPRIPSLAAGIITNT